MGSGVRERRAVGTDTIEEGSGRKYLFQEPGDVRPHEILVFRLEGRLHAMDTLCPHEGGRLAEGPLAAGRYPRCPLHLYKFRPETGEAIDLDPDTGESVRIECEPAKVYEVLERDGEAVIRERPYA